MAVTQGNETYTQNFIRAFTQRGGASPLNTVRYAGLDEQYLMIGDIAAPDRGGVNAINVNDPRQRGLFRRTGVQYDAPDIPSATITFKQRIGGVPWYQFLLNCPNTFFESEGPCNDPADPLNGWSTLNILSRGVSSDKSFKGRTPFDGSDETTAEIKFSFLGGVYKIGGIGIGEVGSVAVTTEIVDGVYYAPVTCTDCGPANDGTRWIALLQQTTGGSSVAVGVVLYSVDGGATFNTSAITGLGLGSLVSAIDNVGQYLVVLVNSENAYYVSQVNQLTGVPGAWVKVTAGFIAAKQPNDLFVLSPTQVFIVGNGGYIYFSSNILAGVTVLNAGSATTNNLNRITGGGGILLAVGATNTILKSTNNGLTWTATTTVTGTLTAASVNSPLQFWVGGANAGVGLVNFTLDGGQTWTPLALPGAATIAVQDIVFPTAECGWIAATRTGPVAALFQTTFSGAIWAESNTSRLPGNLPVAGRFNRLDFPDVPDPEVASNNLLLAGLGGGLVDGIGLIGATAVY